MDNKCIGCGAVLQSEEKKIPGYIPKKTQRDAYCQRCFRIKHYGKIDSVSISEEDFLAGIHGIESDALIINIVDLFDFNGSLISGLNRILPGNECILIGNKLDVFPKSINPVKAIHWMRRMAKEEGMNLIDVEVISALKGKRIDRVIDLINKHQGNRNIYVIGATNTGKSTFINALIAEFTDHKDVITTSKFPGTTLANIEIEVNDNLLIDTPGVINQHQISHYLGESSLAKVMPYKGIKPVIYQVRKGVTLFIGGFARIDIVQGDASFVFYKANSLKIHRTNKIKADDLYKNHLGDMLSPPTIDESKKLGEFVIHNIKLKPKEDLVISGLGFVSVKKDVSIALHLPKKIKYFVREAIL